MTKKRKVQLFFLKNQKKIVFHKAIRYDAGKGEIKMDTLNKNIQKLTKLLEQSQNKKLLWEEMVLISAKAFDLQEKIMEDLDKTEATETNVTKLQAAFSAREGIWDIMTKIAERELELREKTYHKETPEEREQRHKDIMSEANEDHHCCCGGHHGHCCGQHKQTETCCCHQEKPKRKCCRKKK